VLHSPRIIKRKPRQPSSNLGIGLTFLRDAQRTTRRRILFATTVADQVDHSTRGAHATHRLMQSDLRLPHDRKKAYAMRSYSPQAIGQSARSQGRICIRLRFPKCPTDLVQLTEDRGSCGGRDRRSR
jgi:hypothetical protein